MTNATTAQLNRCHDIMQAPAYRAVFIEKLEERRDDLLLELIDKGGDETRFKVQMANEILNYEADIMEEIKARNESARI